MSQQDLPIRAPWQGYNKIRPLASGGAGQVFIATPITADENEEPSSDTTSSTNFVILKRIFIDTAETLSQAQIEIATMLDIPKHINCTQIIDAFKDTDDYVNIVQEYSCVGDLDRLMTAKRKLNKLWSSPEDVVFLAAQILVALRHLHRNKIVHRDMKPSNICLDFFWRIADSDEIDDEVETETTELEAPEGGGGAFSVVKKKIKTQQQEAYSKRCYLWNLLYRNEKRRKYLLMKNHNFDLREMEEEALSYDCGIIEENNNNNIIINDGDFCTPCSACLARLPVSECVVKIADFGVARTLANTKSMRNTVLGTPFYLAPELCESVPYSYPVDMWAFGAVLWEMGCGRCGEERLFKGENMLAVVMAITTCQVRKGIAGEEFDAALMPVVESVVVSDPGERLSADQLLRKFFVKKV